MELRTISPRRLDRAGVVLLGLVGVPWMVSGCPGDDAPTGTGTGGDEDMPDGSDPGPGGPGCVDRIGVAPGFSPHEPVAAAQPGTVARVVEMIGHDDVDEEPIPIAAGASAPSSLVAEGRAVGATTKGPHIHERWGESRKLELSYCINGMPGDDAENEASYHKMIRALNSTMAEWERVSGANFVHVAADDRPEVQPFVTQEGDDLLARADCAAGTNAYFGVISSLNAPQGVTNAVPQAWNDPTLEPIGGDLVRTILLQNGPIAGFGNEQLLVVLRHEIGHIMGFFHEEANHPGSEGSGCSDPEPRHLTPVDPRSVMTTPGCTGFLDDAEHLTHYDRLSAFYLQHTPRSRFETRAAPIGYRYGGVIGGGAEILWHAEGSTQGTLWHPEIGADGITFVAEPFQYASSGTVPLGGWYPSQSEVVIPLKLDAPNSFGLLFHGPGPDVDDLVVFNSAGTTTAVEWSHDAFTVPVVGRFDGSDLGRDVVYLYQPGTEASTALVADDDEVSIGTEVPQQPAFAYPLAAPYRGTAHPDDFVWFEPEAGRVTTWRLASDAFELAEPPARRPQAELGLVPGENIPVIGDFNGDGRADIMWQGVSNLPAGFLDIEDVLWLSVSTPTELAFATIPKSVGHSFRPFVGDFDGDGIDDIFWHRSWGLTSNGPSAWESAPSYVWYFDAKGGHESKPFALDADYSPYVGDFDADGCHDVAWLDSVSDMLHVWRCLPGARDFDCGAAMPAPPDHAPVGMHWGF
jgi:hypothetical protein